MFLTYLPGTWLAYLPAHVLHLDLRWTTLLCYWLVMLGIYLSVRAECRPFAAAVLLLFFCSPYLQYRHEIYTAPHWLFLTAALLLAFRGRAGWSGVLMGVSIAMSQFSWVVFPFYLLFWQQRYGLSRAGIAACASLAAALALVGPFLLWSRRTLMYGVLGHWQGLQINARPANFSSGLSALVGIGHLQLIQAAAIGALLLYCIATKECQTPEGAMRWLTSALLIFVLLNFLVWGYFFLMIALMTLVGVFAANRWLIVDTYAHRCPQGQRWD